ncbi:MAG: RluA family pseudouridine synthase [Eubacterium sp.]|nr:RluA family pseudouridine synthase [Eubacterium sp.]
MKEILIGKVEEGQRLDRFLGKCLPHASGGFLHKMLRKKNITLNGHKAGGYEKIQAGDRIQVYFSDETYEKFSSSSHSLCDRQGGKQPDQVSLSREQTGLREKVKVLYRDEDILVFHKPAGMLSQKSLASDDSLNDYLLDLCKKEGWLSEETMEHFHPSVANRLDRNTSGIVLCGISIRGLQVLSRALKDRELSKYYLALVAGHVPASRLVKGYLTKDEKHNRAYFSRSPGEGALPVETEYQVLAAGKECSLLRIRLITGKSHQIRAHLAGEGYPILGDPKYGDREINRRLKKELGVSHQMLHAYEINFNRYYDGLAIIDEMPEIFCRVMDYYGLVRKGQASWEHGIQED